MLEFILKTVVISIASVIIALIGIAIYRVLIEVNVNNYMERKAATQRDLTSVINMLDAIIETEFNFKLVLPFMGKDIARITNYEDMVKEISVSCMNKIDPDVFITLRVNGVSSEFVASYISRTVMARIIAYMKDNNTGIKKNPNREYEDDTSN